MPLTWARHGRVGTTSWTAKFCESTSTSRKRKLGNGTLGGEIVLVIRNICHNGEIVRSVDNINGVQKLFKSVVEENRQSTLGNSKNSSAESKAKFMFSSALSAVLVGKSMCAGFNTFTRPQKARPSC